MCLPPNRVLRFQSYLEVMTLLEEQYSGKKDIHSHKLFHRMPRTHYVPSKCVCSVVNSVMFDCKWCSVFKQMLEMQL